jgi:hypothetical protein
MVLLLNIELLPVAALLWIWASQPEARGRHIRRLGVVLWGRWLWFHPHNH